MATNEQSAVLDIRNTHLVQYLKTTRAPSYSLLFLLPLLLTYECLALLINVQQPVEVRNGADIILQQLLRILKIESLPLALIIVTLVIIAALSTHLRNGTRLRPGYFGAMFFESCLWAFMIGYISKHVVGLFLSRSTDPMTEGFATQIMLYLGAGVYEELVFRVLLISGLAYVLRSSIHFSAQQASIAAVVLASILFSMFHHVGVLGEPFLWPVFLFRFVAGLLLSILYVTRGFGVTAWSHALYDLFHLIEWI